MKDLWDDLEFTFAPDPITGSILPSIIVVAVAMVLEIGFVAIMISALI